VKLPKIYFMIYHLLSCSRKLEIWELIGGGEEGDGRAEGKGGRGKGKYASWPL